MTMWQAVAMMAGLFLLAVGAMVGLSLVGLGAGDAAGGRPEEEETEETTSVLPSGPFEGLFLEIHPAA